VVLPDASIALDFALVRMTKLIDQLVVDQERMLANLVSTRGLVYSQAVLLALIEEGMTRDEAYRVVQRNAMAAWDDGEQLHDLLAADDAVTLEPEVLADCFSAKRFLRNSGVVFERLGARELG
jgi:adenylosuccinate lyase